MSGNRSALVVGAGIGGLAAAVSLQRAGWRVQVLERAGSPRELGFALALAPNALKALRELGLADTAVAEGADVRTLQFRRPDGSVLKQVTFADRGVDSRSVVTLRPALHGTLLRAVAADALLLGHEVCDVAATGTSAAVTLADGRRLSADVVIGADGVGSALRRRLHPEEPPPRRSGYHALRGVTYDAAHHLDRVSVIVYLGDGIEAGFARASATAVYWYISVVSECVPAGAAAGDVLERCLRGMEPGAAALARAAKPDDMRLEPLFTREPIEEWGRGCSTLLGDAAHPVLPHTAQGAALAIEDAVALGIVLRHAADVPPALRAYEHVRSRRTRQVIGAGPRIASLTTTRSRARIFVRDNALRLLPGILLSGTLRLHARDPHRQLRRA